ncbi:MAG: post-PEP-CTERM-1 domain-containing protein [Candidatus Binatia bacterium]
MKASTCWKIAGFRASIKIAIASAWVTFIPQQVDSTEPHLAIPDTKQVSSSAAQTSEAPDKSSASPQKASGMRIYIDPKSGEISKPPPQPLPVERLQRSLEAAKEPPMELRESLSPRPGGGVMIDLKGRFRSSLRAVRDADGKLSLTHEPETSVSRGEK